MPREHARLLNSIWGDGDWKALTRSAQRRYAQLISQERINYAGVQDLHLKRWSNTAADDSEDQVRADLNELHAARFIAVDTDTEEVLVRSFIRNDEVYKQPRVLQNALAVARQIQSPQLRSVLGEELLKLEGLVPEDGKVKEATWSAVKATAKALIHPNAEGFGKGLANPSGDPSGKGSVPESKHRRSGASAKPFPKPFPEPFGKPPGVGEGVGVSSSSSVGLEESSSRARTRTHARDTRLADLNDSAHSHDAHRLLEAWIGTCSKRPPTAVLNKLGPIVDRLLADGYTDTQIHTGLTEWTRKGLGAHLLAEVVHEVVNSDRGRHLRSVEDIPDEELTREFLERELGPDYQSKPTAPYDIEFGDPAARQAWYREAGQQRLAERRAEYRRRAKNRTPA